MPTLCRVCSSIMIVREPAESRLDRLLEHVQADHPVRAGGRQLPDETQQVILQLAEAGLSQRRIAAVVGCSRPAVRRVLYAQQTAGAA